jgi:transposase InsO family protein
MFGDMGDTLSIQEMVGRRLPMPWEEQSVPMLREEFVRLALHEGSNKQELCRRFGISRKTGYKMLARFSAEGRAGLEDRSRCPHHSPRRTAAAVEAEVLAVREAHNGAWGGRKIAASMKRSGHCAVPAASTITQILRRHGKLEASRAEHPGPCQRFERAYPNELWQIDFKGDFALLAAGRCHPLTMLDDHSRFCLILAACGDEQDKTVRGYLITAFKHYGLPREMLMDGGSPWGDTAGQSHTAFTVWLMRLGIRVGHGRPYHPQTRGKEERFHRSLKAELLKTRTFRDLEDCQRAFDPWRQVYNYERPHEALGLAVPGDRYRPSPRSYPAVLPAIEYAAGDQVRKVDSEGFISFRNRPWRISKAFRGQPVAVRPTQEDGVFTVHFCQQKIALLDLRQPTMACGVVDIAGAMPTTPQAPQQKQEILV